MIIKDDKLIFEAYLNSNSPIFQEINGFIKLIKDNRDIIYNNKKLYRYIIEVLNSLNLIHRQYVNQIIINQNLLDLSFWDYVIDHNAFISRDITLLKSFQKYCNILLQIVKNYKISDKNKNIVFKNNKNIDVLVDNIRYFLISKNFKEIEETLKIIQSYDFSKEYLDIVLKKLGAINRKKFFNLLKGSEILYAKNVINRIKELK